MRIYSKEELEDVEALAFDFFSYKEIKIMLGLHADFLKDVLVADSDVYNAYWKGWYSAEAQFRKKVKATALLGSSPAQTLINSLMLETKKKNMNR